jgi:hypothetical protein
VTLQEDPSQHEPPVPINDVAHVPTSLRHTHHGQANTLYPPAHQSGARCQRLSHTKFTLTAISTLASQQANGKAVTTEALTKLDCGWYEEQDACEFASKYENDGYTATEACCFCGGGNL